MTRPATSSPARSWTSSCRPRWRRRSWETDFTVTPSPHHPIGAKGVGESPNVGGVPCFSNAVNDAFSFLGSTHIQMPHDYLAQLEGGEGIGSGGLKGHRGPAP